MRDGYALWFDLEYTLKLMAYLTAHIGSTLSGPTCLGIWGYSLEVIRRCGVNILLDAAIYDLECTTKMITYLRFERLPSIIVLVETRLMS